jgi:hypothetical protein
MSDKVSDTRLDQLIAHYAGFPPQNYELTAPVLSALCELRALRAPASGDAPCGCEFSDAGELEQMCMAHWRYAFVTINAGKQPPYIPGLPPIKLQAADALSAASRDGERYRWLRDVGNTSWVALANVPDRAFKGPMGAEAVDAAIDRAMRES